MSHTNQNAAAAGRRATFRRGFTLVELLVVIAIISTLIGLLLPAVQSSREAARRCGCSNHVAQIGLGLHSYEFAHEAFPAGVSGDTGPIRNLPEGHHVGWMVQILPFMEETRLVRHFTAADGVYAPSNRLVREARINWLLCPSSPTEPFRTGADGNTVAVTSYAGCHNDAEAPIDTDNRGILFLESRIRFCDIADGSSNTLLIGERLGSEADLGWASGTRATLRNTSLLERRALTSRGDAPAPEDPLVVGGFGSEHPGFVIVGMADGSVSAVAFDVSPTLLRQLGDRADGELPSRD